MHSDLGDVRFVHDFLGQDFITALERYLADAEFLGRIQCAQSALGVSEIIPESAYLQTSNALSEAHRRFRPRRDADEKCTTLSFHRF